MFVTEGDGAVQELQQLLADPNIEVAVRQGDIYAVIVEYFAANNNFKPALSALQEMKAKLPKVSPFTYSLMQVFIWLSNRKNSPCFKQVHSSYQETLCY